MTLSGRFLIGLMTATLLFVAGAVSFGEGQTTFGGALIALGILRGAVAIYQWRRWRDEAE